MLVNPWDLYGRLKSSLRLSFGKLEGEWENHRFPVSAAELRRSLFTWARLQLIGQALIVSVSFYFHLWLIPVLVTLAPFYGGGLLYLCNDTQHVGLHSARRNAIFIIIQVIFIHMLIILGVSDLIHMTSSLVDPKGN